MSPSTVNKSRAPRNRELDRKTQKPAPRIRAQIESARGRRPAAVSAKDVLIARTEARALLWQAGELDLHTAVDDLQVAAQASRLVAEIGQDAVQAIIAQAFEAVR
jgi:hypothetical protein